MEFRLLGDIEVYADGQPIDIGYLQRRCVLAVLLTEANRVVRVDQFVDRVWENRRLPKNPRGAVQHNITMLRKVLPRNATIVWQNPGYRLTVQPETVDLHRFDQLVDRARTADDDERAAALFEQALGLWRGQPFAGVDLGWFNEIRATATKRHNAAWLDLVDVQLRRGRHAEVLAELSGRVERDPLDERLAGQYMVALYHSGRPADALAHYQQLRQRLAEEMGTDPGPSLRRTHQQILTTDPALGVPVRVSPTAHIPVPRQLPAPPRLFTGRFQELAHLTAIVNEQPAGTMPISVIDGAGGIGKTWLALHWAHEHLDRFPDGQLHVNLCGFDPSGNPTPPAIAIRGFLDALGVEPAAVPPEPDAQIGLYRSLLVGKRMLILLDNARDTAQVTPLLPGSRTCTVLVTSRHRLDGLATAHGAQLLDLDVLPDAQARELLVRHIGSDRVAAEPGPVTEILVYCAGLPLAVSIVAARASRYPRFPLAELAEELRDHSGRLDAMETGDTQTNLRAVLSWSHHAMSPDAAAAFGLLGLAPGDDISLPAAANLFALPLSGARLVLRELEHGNLVQQHIPGRYHMHDLVRLFAANCAHQEENHSQAMRRVVDFYLHTAFAGDQLLQPLLPPIKLGEPASDCRPYLLRDQGAALAWFTAEHSNLLAAQHLAAEQGWAASVYQLAWILTTFLYRQGQFLAALAVWQAGQDATGQLNDAASRAGAHQLLGALHAELGRPAEALQHLAQAEELGDLSGQAYTHHTLGWFWSLQGDSLRALEHASHALRLYRTLDMPAGETRQLTVTTWYYAQMGDYEKARTYGDSALAMARSHQYREDEAIVLAIFGYIHQHAARYSAAVDLYLQSHTLLHEIGSTYFEANVLDYLGHAHVAVGEPGAAYRVWEQALQLCLAQRRTTDAARIQQQLDALASSATSKPVT